MVCPRPVSAFARCEHCCRCRWLRFALLCTDARGLSHGSMFTSLRYRGYFWLKALCALTFGFTS